MGSFEIKQFEFIKSSSKLAECPAPDQAEYAFIGRSNVGKSSLINMLCNSKKLAKISENPGKTRLINHFRINDAFYLVDLPGYGYAKTSKSNRAQFQEMIKDYIIKRNNLYSLFLLIDSRHKPQKNDMAFMQWLGEQGIPFVILFTKMDKLSSSQVNKNIKQYKKQLMNEWEELPEIILTSSRFGQGKQEILNYIEKWNNKLGLKPPG